MTLLVAAGTTCLKPKSRLFPQQVAASRFNPINGAPTTGNIHQEVDACYATLAMAHALVGLPLLGTGQRQKCLHFIHHVIFL